MGPRTCLCVTHSSELSQSQTMSLEIDKYCSLLYLYTVSFINSEIYKSSATSKPGTNLFSFVRVEFTTDKINEVNGTKA